MLASPDSLAFASILYEDGSIDPVIEAEPIVRPIRLTP